MTTQCPFNAIPIQVIRTTLELRGRGESPEDPVRRITQYWSLEGELLAEADPWANRHNSTIQHKD